MIFRYRKLRRFPRTLLRKDLLLLLPLLPFLFLRFIKLLNQYIDYSTYSSYHTVTIYLSTTLSKRFRNTSLFTTAAREVGLSCQRVNIVLKGQDANEVLVSIPFVANVAKITYIIISRVSIGKAWKSRETRSR